MDIMTEQEINIAIAESQGIEKIKEGWGWCFSGIEFVGDMPSHIKLPNYCQDRNAMMGAWKSLPFDSQLKAMRELYEILDREYSNGEVEWSDVVADPVEISLALFTADLTHITEAYCRTLNLWV